jgi:hypothetical protein
MIISKEIGDIGNGGSKYTELLHKLTNFSDPIIRHVFVAPYYTVQFIAGLISDDCWVFCVGKTSVGIHVCEQVLDVILEKSDDLGIGVKFQCVWWEGVIGTADVVACPAEEGEFPTMIIILKGQLLLKFQGQETHIVISQWNHEP